MVATSPSIVTDFKRLNYQKARSGVSIDATDDDDPVWELRTNVLACPAAGDLSKTTSLMKVDVQGVSGAFLVSNLLTPEECEHLLCHADRMGFSRGLDVVNVPAQIRNNDVCVYIAPASLTSELSRRLMPFIPHVGFKQCSLCKPDFVNAKFRCYRYKASDKNQQGQRFGPHYDGPQFSSKAKDGQLEEEQSRRSQLSILLYLNDCSGGETIFYPTGNPDDAHAAVKVAPCQGSALCFWNGDHPQSPLHEGSPLTDGSEPKYVIRTDILYSAPAVYESWESSSYKSMAGAAAWMMSK
eukprot:gnl/MRDRNA2_/MRDRNA2_87538_c0_seq1.p1 gnl/MRDRNA2_/MRDRNA2_87538_c0~~gnl/MRDRNA2_/MRDRNA2_87538_c0_seq1.p1  ORF type:complete len:297 (+),score=54.56 gnl/MRDRNA2_/MRDRNA2_87538_c0_seq1:89-979(+)